MQSTNVTVYLFSIGDGKIRKLPGVLWSFGEESSDPDWAARTMDTKVELLTACDGETEMVFRQGYHFDLQEEGEAEVVNMRAVKIFNRYGYDYIVVTEDKDKDDEAVRCFLYALGEETAAIKEHISSLEKGYEEILGALKRLEETGESH